MHNPVNHTHEHLDSPGDFTHRDQVPSGRDFNLRPFTIGIGGPVAVVKQPW